MGWVSLGEVNGMIDDPCEVARMARIGWRFTSVFSKSDSIEVRMLKL